MQMFLLCEVAGSEQVLVKSALQTMYTVCQAYALTPLT